MCKHLPYELYQNLENMQFLCDVLPNLASLKDKFHKAGTNHSIL